MSRHISSGGEPVNYDAEGGSRHSPYKARMSSSECNKKVEKVYSTCLTGNEANHDFISCHFGSSDSCASFIRFPNILALTCIVFIPVQSKHHVRTRGKIATDI